MTRRTLGFTVLAVACLGIEAEAGTVKVSGRVVNADGQPAAGVGVANVWDFSGGEVDALDGVKTNADGRFTIPVEFASDRAVALMAADEAGKLGALAVVKPADAGKPVDFRLVPLVRVLGDFTSSDPAFPVKMAGIYVMAGPGRENPACAQWFSIDAEDLKKGQAMPERPTRFELWLPPGEYNFQCYEPSMPAEHKRTARVVTVPPDRPGIEYDLGKIELKLNPLVKLYGKEPPHLTIKAARGVPRGVQLADFKGKYVLLEFWATWCGPCVARGLPDVMDLYDEHEADRDKFVILAVHGTGSDDLADVDKKLIPIVRDTWAGRPLPFPILLDDHGQTFEAFGVEGIPATVLIGPDGKVVEGGVEALREALPEIPLARRLPRALDRQFAFGLGSEGAPLGAILEALCGQARIEVQPDVAAMASAKVQFASNVPLTITGQVSLRSWLDLLLSPMGLVAVPGPDGLIVTTPDPARVKDEGPSEPQRRCAERIARKLEARTSFNFSKATLAEVAKHFEEETTENFVLDPADRKAGRLDPDATVTGKADGVTLQEGLKALLAPLGIEAIIKDEVVILTKSRP